MHPSTTPTTGGNLWYVGDRYYANLYEAERERERQAAREARGAEYRRQYQERHQQGVA